MITPQPPLPLIRKRLLVVAVLGLLLLLLSLVAQYPFFIENYYSRGVYPFIAAVQHAVFNFIPVSVGDVFYLVLIAGLMYVLVKLVRLAIHKQFRVMRYLALKVVISVQVLILLFYSCWGLNYFRPAVAQTAHLQDTSYTSGNLKAITALLIDSVNAQAAVLTSANRNQTNVQIYERAVQAINRLGKESPVFYDNSPAVKPSLFTPLLNYMGTLGYYNPFTGEAQMNYQMPIVNKPVTCTHEMGHQMGYGREDEANFIGFVAGINSGNRMLQYSAYYLGVMEFLHHLHRRDSVAYRQLKQHLSAPVRADMKADSVYWTSFESKAGIISSLFYDQFLKANNQPAGLFTYNRMIRLTMAYYKRRQPGLFYKTK